jgi:hypothetical protein
MHELVLMLRKPIPWVETLDMVWKYPETLGIFFLNICDIELEKNIKFFSEMVRYDIKFRSKFWDLKSV